MNTAQVLLGIGANKSGIYGKPIDSICWAFSRLNAFGNTRTSPLYKTLPVHYSRQPMYHNAVVELFTHYSPTALLLQLLQLEKHAGRNRKKEKRFGSRPLDIDILTYEKVVIRSPYLQIPHPRMHKRGFVLVPLLFLLPYARDPRTNCPWAHYPAASSFAAAHAIDCHSIAL